MNIIIFAGVIAVLAAVAPVCILAAYRQGWEDGAKGRQSIPAPMPRRKQKKRELTPEELKREELNRKIDEFVG